MLRNTLLLLTSLSASLLAQTPPPPLTPSPRPPAIPLIAYNPYFSIWSFTDILTDSPTRHWTGHPQPIAGLIRIDGKLYRIIGPDPDNVPALPQTAMQLTPTHTRYQFAGAGIELTLTFFTPAFLDDLDTLSRPVTYLRWDVRSTDAAQHAVQVFLDASPEIATSYDHQPVTFARNQTESTHVLSVGTASQSVLNRSGDDLRIDWGYLHLAIPDSEPSHSTISRFAAHDFASSGTLPVSDAGMDGPTPTDQTAPHLAVEFPLGEVGAASVSRHLLIGYTENYAIQYMHQDLRPWWQRNSMPVAAMLDEAEAAYPQLEAKGNHFDAELTADLTKAAGAHYAWLCTLAYRQAIAAHSLVAGPDGKPMLFAKENFSNGDIGTVDVLYPSAPIFLFFNPRLLEAQVRPVLAYAANPSHWHFPFAPHDLGQFPLANGQNYGGGEKTEDDQMPVEESGNLILCVDAIARLGHSTELAETYWPQLTQWAMFLKQHGLDPENQLTTDDFAGHVTHNANLALKAIDALAAYADLARILHHESEAHEYEALAKSYASKWITLDREGDHFKLAYDSPGTWSQKYNLVWDKVLDFNLFPPSVRASEIAFYKTKLNKYGLPLDSRKTYTKLDWSLWTATLADMQSDFDALVDPIYLWTQETTTRVPLTDWYDTITGKQVGFQARSVVGGLFIRALDDKPLAAKYRAQAR
jgi:hypothetical protein